MKNVIIILAITVISFTAISFTDGIVTKTNIPGGNNPAFSIPDNVQTIIDNSCYGCHNSDSKSTKGKMKLRFDKMPNMKTGKLVGKLSKIRKTITKGKMPPKKILAEHPEMALTKEEASIMTTWANDVIKELSGE